jgi:hypothetical protein
MRKCLMREKNALLKKWVNMLKKGMLFFGLLKNSECNQSLKWKNF